MSKIAAAAIITIIILQLKREKEREKEIVANFNPQKYRKQKNEKVNGVKQ